MPATDFMAVEDTAHVGILVHRPDGSPLYINPRHVAYVREPLNTESGNATIVFVSSGIQSTSETVAEIVALIGDEKRYEKGIPNGRP